MTLEGTLVVIRNQKEKRNKEKSTFKFTITIYHVIFILSGPNVDQHLATICSTSLVASQIKKGKDNTDNYQTRKRIKEPK